MLSIRNLVEIDNDVVSERDVRALEQFWLNAGFSIWLKQPPRWFIECYLDQGVLRKAGDGVAFELIPSRPGYYKAICPLLFTHMIIVGSVNDRIGYGDRWCYEDFESAFDAFSKWDAALGTEPDGWHRHPDTGRRRKKNEEGVMVDYAIF